MPEQRNDTRADQRRATSANGSGAGRARVHASPADESNVVPQHETARDVPAVPDRVLPSPFIVIDPEDSVDRVSEHNLILPTFPTDVASVDRWERPRDLVSLGECLVEMSRRPDGTYQPSIAGDAYNTLFYASRLGLRSGLITAVGDDLFTPMIVERIVDEGIDLSHVQRLGGRRNGIYFIE
ncbi:MAG: hypothetical protein H7X80_08845, partial [bacterium]|nr:hypothetical protein [Candidatus Kapabacteria bacterium]